VFIEERDKVAGAFGGGMAKDGDGFHGFENVKIGFVLF
jgi:hypothetical protein